MENGAKLIARFEQVNLRLEDRTADEQQSVHIIASQPGFTNVTSEPSPNFTSDFHRNTSDVFSAVKMVHNPLAAEAPPEPSSMHPPPLTELHCEP